LLIFVDIDQFIKCDISVPLKENIIELVLSDFQNGSKIATSTKATVRALKTFSEKKEILNSKI
jgi:hypothetical protein